MKGGVGDLQAMSRGPNSFNTSIPSTWLALAQTWGRNASRPFAELQLSYNPRMEG